MEKGGDKDFFLKTLLIEFDDIAREVERFLPIIICWDVALILSIPLKLLKLKE